MRTTHPHPFPCFLVINDQSLGAEKTHNFLNTTWLDCKISIDFSKEYC